ncbi:MAG: alpha/beta fold hydrolase [Deltaproteobacteria bacterium]|nr:alpha/beta fold hydrolase [Deltaproteobacteria bacterium]MBW1921983.1 alpha/beta fold hydrolase [Deltaproteobacteria bacterium]MBW1948748.1 alpha/beta fold hydrolase [Deltaproteobacteria bacterium]MBW2006426.1 alpha/beta fold hydrolase [Deltaproteobacteria bacterium]MBW2102048.1 alpha/beta fold hydrolase [Deltaproteobacteria bacterium]
MREEPIRFQSGDLGLEGLLFRGSGSGGVVITHPHPLYGGSMHNNVVEAVHAAYAAKGFTTLRFNFRGVGASEGAYDEGRGEAEDVLAAMAVLKEGGAEEIHLAGYSFGAWVIAGGLDRYADASRIIMISPPVAFMEFPRIGPDARIGLVVTGAGDDIAPPGSVKKMAVRWNPKARLEVIPGADHFFWGAGGRLRDAIGRFLEQEAGARGESS